MRKFFNRIEKFLIRFAIFSLVLLVVVQGLMIADPLRFYLSWGERLEGQTLNLPVNSGKEKGPTGPQMVESPEATFSISVDKFSSLPKAKILINGQEKSTFDSQTVEVKVRAGDTVEIDATAYNFPVRFKIGAVSKNLAVPGTGKVFDANQSIVMLGKVIVK